MPVEPFQHSGAAVLSLGTTMVGIGVVSAVLGFAVGGFVGSWSSQTTIVPRNGSVSRQAPIPAGDYYLVDVYPSLPDGSGGPVYRNVHVDEQPAKVHFGRPGLHCDLTDGRG